MSLHNTAPTWLRAGLMVLGLVLAVQAIWIILPEYYHPRRIQLPVDQQSSFIARFEQENAKRAARLAVIRGDLWAESAFTYSGLLWTEPEVGQDASDEKKNEARMNLERALQYSPHRGDVWLMLAAMADRYDRLGYQPSSLLKMSYYTAPNELSLFPLRFRVSLRPNGLQDLEIQDMIRRDIRMVIIKAPALKPALVTAYGAASSQSKAFIDRVVSEIDPAYLAAMRAGSQ